jgi:hypothetical protein
LVSTTGDALKREKAKNGGVLLTDLAAEALKALTAADKSRLDLVMVSLADGPQLWIPWAALKTLRLELKVPELTLKVRPTSGDLPYAGVTAWEGHRASAVEFANVQQKLGPWFLTKRTDPIALRGEKLFVQGCASCYAQGAATTLSALKPRLRALGEQPFEHPALKPSGARPVKLSEKDQRALATYVVVSEK